MKIRALLLAILAVGSLQATAQTISDELNAPIKEAAFKAGEKLTFTLKHSYIDSDIVEVVFQTSATIVDNIPAYKIYANGKTFPGYRLIYDLDDTYETWLDISTLRPIQFRSRLKENKYRFRADYKYDWEAGKVHTTYQNLKRPTVNEKTMDLPAGAGDALAFFYNLRSEDIASFRPGEKREFYFVMDKKVSVITYKLIGRETKKIGRRGTFKTLKIACSLVTTDDPEGQTFKEGTEFYLWLSDDRNHIPLYIESPIKVGSIVAVITKYEGLKYPLDSKIK